MPASRRRSGSLAVRGPLMRRSVVLACFSLACAGRQPAASSPNPAANLDRPPQALGKWRFIDSTVYEVNNGVSYRYTRSDGIRVDVYEYPIIPQGHPCRESCARSAVAAGVEEFQASIPAIVAQSGLDSIVSGERRSLKADESSWLEAGARFQFRIYGDTNRFESSLFLFSGRDTFLKVRATYRQGEDRSASVDSLITQVLRAWPPPYDCAAGEAAGDGIVMSATLARPASAIAERVKVAADSLHYSFAFADAAQGRWRTHPPVPLAARHRARIGGWDAAPRQHPLRHDGADRRLDEDRSRFASRMSGISGRQCADHPPAHERNDVHQCPFGQGAPVSSGTSFPACTGEAVNVPGGRCC